MVLSLPPLRRWTRYRRSKILSPIEKTSVIDPHSPYRLNYSDHVTHLAEIRYAALAAADPWRAVTRNLRLVRHDILAGPHNIELKPNSRIYLVALGKAAPAMCQAAAEVLGERLTTGIAAIPHDYTDPLPPGIKPHPAGHPLPDKGSLAAGQAVYDLLSATRPDDLVLVLISGGGSAMLELPVPDVNLEDLRTLNTLLLHSGAPIETINTVRQAVSQTKAGGLARMASPAPVVALILSDVVGDRLSTIASGPTVLRKFPTRKEKWGVAMPQTARGVLEHFSIWDLAPQGVRTALGRPEAPQPRARRPLNILIGSNRQVVNAAADRAVNLGFKPRVISFRMRGEARDVGYRLGRSLCRAKRPACLLMGGESTVTVLGDGRGGRNQELALSAALVLESTPNTVVMALATDGVDGPTDAAGAIVSSQTISQAHALGLDPVSALEQNNAYPLLEAIGALLRTGPTGTNLNDLVVGLAYS